MSVAWRAARRFVRPLAIYGRGAPLGGVLVLMAVVGQACGAPVAPLLGPATPAPWPTAPTPRRTPIVMPAPTEPPPEPTVTPTRAPADFIGRQRAQVLRVWDGQSILIERGVTIRYAGIQAPGAGTLRRPVEAWGREAALRNAELVEGKEIELEQDTTDVDTDGRLPRYVYVDGQLVNKVLVQSGLAQVATGQGPDVRHREQLLEAEQDAREARRGLWANAPTVTRTPAAPPRPPQPPRPPVSAGTPSPGPEGTPGTVTPAGVQPRPTAPSGPSAAGPLPPGAGSSTGPAPPGAPAPGGPAAPGPGSAAGPLPPTPRPNPVPRFGE